MNFDIRLGEFRLMFRRGRVLLFRFPLGWGFALGWTGTWGLWSKRATFSRVVSEWAGLDVEDLI